MGWSPVGGPGSELPAPRVHKSQSRLAPRQAAATASHAEKKSSAQHSSAVEHILWWPEPRAARVPSPGNCDWPYASAPPQPAAQVHARGCQHMEETGDEGHASREALNGGLRSCAARGDPRAKLQGIPNLPAPVSRWTGKQAGQKPRPRHRASALREALRQLAHGAPVVLAPLAARAGRAGSLCVTRPVAGPSCCAAHPGRAHTLHRQQKRASCAGGLPPGRHYTCRVAHAARTLHAETPRR
jgi:hypothetical protein